MASQVGTTNIKQIKTNQFPSGKFQRILKKWKRIGVASRKMLKNAKQLLKSSNVNLKNQKNNQKKS